MLHRRRRSIPAVTNGSERLLSPLLRGLVERILQHTRDRVIVFGDHEDETVIPCEHFLPAQCLGVLAGRPHNRPLLIEERQRMVEGSRSSASMSSRACACFSIQPAALSAYRPGRVEPITTAMRGFAVMITSYFDFGCRCSRRPAPVLACRYTPGRSSICHFER